MLRAAVILAACAAPALPGIAAASRHESGQPAQSAAGDATGSPLHEAAQRGDLTRLGRLLDEGVDVNAPGEAGRTALHVAAAARMGAVVERLLAAGADADAPDANGTTPLHEAAGRGHVEIVRRLLDAGADPAVADPEGRTALHRAVNGQHTPVIRALAEHGEYPLAQVHLARMYSRGAGVPRDYTLARDWLERAAASGHIQALLLLAELLTKGPQELRDGPAALEWLDRAARPEAGAWRREAWFRMGVIHAEGIGVEPDPAKARGLFRLAADGAHPGANYALGVMYLEGRGMTADPGKGIQLMERAARLGHAMAPLMLGRVYAGAQEAEQYADEAYQWFTVAMRTLPDGPRKQQAEQARNRVADLLDEAQRGEAREQASRWIGEYR